MQARPIENHIKKALTLVGQASWTQSLRTTQALPQEQSGLMKRPTILSEAHLSALFTTLSGLYTNLFTAKYGIKDNGTWFEVLKDLTPMAINKGLEKLRDLSVNLKFVDYPPNPLQFRALCMSWYEDLGLPKASAAYEEILQFEEQGGSTWSHSVVRYIAHKLVNNNFYGFTRDCDRYGRFLQVYDEVCLRVRKGFILPEINMQKDIRKKVTPGVSTANLAQMKRLLGVKNA